MQRPDEQSAFSHFILMRFNVRSKHVAESRDAAIRARKDWLDSRFKLFEEFCWPTLEAQSCKDFQLHVYFDQETPKDYLENFNVVTKQARFAKIVLCEYFDVEVALKSVMASQPQRPWILSTRLDNDDGLHRDFVKTLQSVARAGLVEAINFPRGMVLTNDALYESHQSSNAFISIMEQRARCRTVMQLSHNQIDRRFQIRDIVAPPMWLQHVHGGNVSNKIRGRRLPSKRLPEGFDNLDLQARVKPVGSLQTLVENVTMGSLRYSRDKFAKVARRMRIR